LKKTDIDVLGINFSQKAIYNCQVAVHIKGLHYINYKNGRRVKDNYGRLKPKFERSIEFIEKNFKGLFDNGYTHKVFFFSPVVIGRDISELERLRDELVETYRVEFELFVNEKFLDAMTQLRRAVAQRTEEIKDPIARFLQVEETLKRKFKKSY